jgi:predicted nucleic acid-binding protein
MNVLVDTSIWIQHFKKNDEHLVSLMAMDSVLVHPMVAIEIACGTPPERNKTLVNINLLKQAIQATFAEVKTLIEQEKLYGLGCGLVDISLLTSTLLTPDTTLWTSDKSLAKLAMRFNVLYTQHRPN